MGTRVFVGRLHPSARERDLERFFRGYGRIREIMLKRGFAFVEFEDYRDADDATYELNGKDVLGERVTVEIARGTPHGRDRDGWRAPPQRSPRRGGSPRRSGGGGGRRDLSRSEYRITVENLSSRVSWQDLKDLMREAGDVVYADTNSRYNEGTVEFASKSDMNNALEKLDGKEVNGRKIKLRCEYKGGRSRSRSRSKSKSRSPRRSRSKHSRSRSASPKGKTSDKLNDSADQKAGSRSRSPSRSRSKSHSRSRSATPDKQANGRNGKDNGNHSDDD